MELLEYPKRTGRPGILLLRVTHAEALDLIASLAQQIRNGDCNTHRIERYLKDGRDFSIAVHKELK